MELLDLADWRRRVSSLYAAVRAAEDPEQAHALWRDARDELLRTHPASPIPPERRAQYPGADIAPYDPAFRFEVEIVPAEPETRTTDVGGGESVPLDRMGRVALPGLGSLDVWWVREYGGGVFLPVRDLAPRSYPGGRYVLDTAKGADLGPGAAELVVDLNFAFQPSCAYSPRWTCPLPGPGNTLTMPAPVGEGHHTDPGT